LNHEFGEIKKVIEHMPGPERLRLGLSFVFEYSLVDCAIKKGPDIARGITQSAINAFERGIPAEEALTMLAHEIGVPLQDAISLVSKSSSTSKIIGSGITKIAKQTIATGSPAVRAAQEVSSTEIRQSEMVVNAAVNAEKTATIWDNIEITQPFYPNTKIPKSFEIYLENGKFWVHPNATEHMFEFFKTKAPSFSTPINCQSLLTDFANSAAMAIKDGIKYDTMITVGKWEFRFGAPRESSLLPTIYHALYKP